MFKTLFFEMGSPRLAYYTPVGRVNDAEDLIYVFTTPIFNTERVIFCDTVYFNNLATMDYLPIN